MRVVIRFKYQQSNYRFAGSRQWCLMIVLSAKIYQNNNLLYRIGILTHGGWVMFRRVSNVTIIGSDDGLSPSRRRQAIICPNARLTLIGPLGTNFCENLIKLHAFSFKMMHLKMSSGKWRTSCLGLNVSRVNTDLSYGIIGIINLNSRWNDSITANYSQRPAKRESINKWIITIVIICLALFICAVL